MTLPDGLHHLGVPCGVLVHGRGVQGLLGHVLPLLVGCICLQWTELINMSWVSLRIGSLVVELFSRCEGLTCGILRHDPRLLRLRLLLDDCRLQLCWAHARVPEVLLRGYSAVDAP